MHSIQAAEITVTEIKLLSILQVCDSFFPTGGYTQSFGLETYVQLGIVKDEETLFEFLSTYLKRAVANSDGLVIRLAYRAFSENDMEMIVRLDDALDAQKVAREPREASIRIGRQILNTVQSLLNTPNSDPFLKLVRENKVQGHQSLVYAHLGHRLDWGEDITVLAFMYSSVSAMVNNALKSVPLGQTTGQRVLQRLRVPVLEAAAMSKDLVFDDLGGVSPGLDVRAIQHEYLYARMFAS
ncbi:MAG: urease accessory protein UreF [Candidatus Brocadia sp.]|nr:urease accessory protein UreF [Candidatus Brocadia sp.]